MIDLKMVVEEQGNKMITVFTVDGKEHLFDIQDPFIALRLYHLFNNSIQSGHCLERRIKHALTCLETNAPNMAAEWLKGQYDI